MRARPAGPGDTGALRAFSCAGPHAHPKTRELEVWIQRKAVGWCRATRDARIQLLVDDDDNILGVYGYEPGALVVALGDDPEDEPRERWFVKFVAVASEHHGEGLGGRLLETCLDELSELAPDAEVYWKVEEFNDASHKMSLRAGAEAEPPVGKLTTYFILV